MVMRTPRTLNLGITSRCNLRCRYCSHFDSPAEAKADLPADEWRRFFEELRRCSVMDVRFSGGEPLLRKDLKELIQAAVSNRMRFAILTNGTLLDENWAEFIAKTQRCNYVQVSLDSYDPAVHDACRGMGSHQKALEAIRLLRSYGAPVTVRITINRLNLGDLERTAEFLLDELNLPSFSTNAAGYMGMCRHEPENLMLTLEERSYAIDALLRLDERYEGRIQAQAGPLADGRMWTKMIEARENALPGFLGGGHLTACGCPGSEIAVRSDGVIVPCPLMSHIELGRINRDDLQEIWLNHPKLKGIRERSILPLAGFEFCQGCDYIPYCTGNCPALAYTTLGVVDHPSPESCLKRFLDAGGVLPTTGDACR